MKKTNAKKALKKLKNYRAMAYSGGSINEVVTYGSSGGGGPSNYQYNPTNMGGYRPGSSYFTNAGGGFGGGGNSGYGGPATTPAPKPKPEETPEDDPEINEIIVNPDPILVSVQPY